MAKRANNIVPAKAEAIKKRIREGVDQPQKEWRVDGHPGLILITRPSGTGAFYAYYNPTFGKTRRKLPLGDFPATPLADAIQKAKDVRADVGRGADPVAERQRQKASLTFQAVAERFLEEAPLAANTRETYAWSLNRHVYPAIGMKPATMVTPEDVLGVCAKIKAKSPTQAQRVKAIIGGVYRWGIKNRLVTKNPAREVGNQQDHKSKRERVPTDDEIKALWRALDKANRMSKSVKLIIKLGILTGLRRTEIAGAEVRELDADLSTWTIPATLVKAGKVVKEGRMKNGREQRVYLSSQAAALLDEARKTTSNAVYLFPADTSRVKKTRKPHIHGESVTRAMRRVAISDISIHDMRRAITTYLGNKGVSRDVLQMILHHTPGDVIGEHYDHAKRESEMRAAWQVWADHVESVVG